VSLWRRHRRRSLAPRRPAVFPEQRPLAVFVGVLLAAGVVLVLVGVVAR
jgi:hypothetical protein